MTFGVMNKIFKSLSNQKASDGFTLVELLVAIVITSIVITATGFGVVAITQNDKKAKAETERRVELNRALDFIADEVRQAKPIATDASANLSTVAPDFNSSGKTPILTLQIPNIPQRVIYYIAPKATGSAWLGPNVVYRWGPNFKADGTYNYPTTPPTTPANWTYEPLADLIVNTTPILTPTCPTGTLNPSSGITGFYACIDPSGRIADIHLRGELKDAYGNFRTPLEVSSKVFARPYNAPFALGSSTAPSSGSGGTVTITQPSSAYFEVLGGSMYCPGKGEIPTTTTLNVTQGATTTNTTVPSSTKALNLSAAPGTKITVTGFADNSWCSSIFPDHTFNSETNKNTQVWSLRNGDTPPPFAPYGTQANIDAFLKNYLDANGKVKLAENQVIYLFELFTTNTSDSTYDMQDLVVLATIVPKSN